MTKEEKKERRDFRHKLQALAFTNLSRDFKLTATNRQMKAKAKELTDRIISRIVNTKQNA